MGWRTQSKGHPGALGKTHPIKVMGITGFRDSLESKRLGRSHTRCGPLGHFSMTGLYLDAQAAMIFILTLARDVLFSYLHAFAHIILPPRKLPLFLHDSQSPRCPSGYRWSSSSVLSCACLWDALAPYPAKEGCIARLQGGGSADSLQLSAPSRSASAAGSSFTQDHTLPGTISIS